MKNWLRRWLGSVGWSFCECRYQLPRWLSSRLVALNWKVAYRHYYTDECNVPWRWKLWRLVWGDRWGEGGAHRKFHKCLVRITLRRAQTNDLAIYLWSLARDHLKRKESKELSRILGFTDAWTALNFASIVMELERRGLLHRLDEEDFTSPIPPTLQTPQKETQ